MKMVKSKFSYYNRLVFFVSTVIILTLVTVLLKSRVADWKILTGISIALIVIFFSQKKVEAISLDKGFLEIVNVFWFVKKIFREKTTKINLRVSNKVTFRGGAISILQVLEGSNLLFEIEEHDGFKKEDFDGLVQFFNQQA